MNKDTKLSAEIGALVAPFQAEQGGLMPALWAIQNQLGYIPPDHVPEIAKQMNLSIAEVHGVLGFYHDFRSTEPVKHTIKLCRAEACQAMGSRALQTAAQRIVGSGFDAPAGDNGIELRSVYCLGLCANAPAAMIDGELHASLDEATLKQLVAEMAVQASTESAHD